MNEEVESLRVHLEVAAGNRQQAKAEVAAQEFGDWPGVTVK
jgi:hypothetical protein